MAGQNPIVKIFSCSQSIDLASKIAEHYGLDLGMLIFLTTAMVNINRLSKNQLEERDYSS